MRNNICLGVMMPREYKRVIAPRIMYVLEKNKKVGMRFSEIFKALTKNNWVHNQSPIAQNLKWLVEQDKLAHIGDQYSLIQTRENGTKFCIIKDPVERVVELDE
jgi:hypothetical protein